jgi:uncharacterized membrane protein YkvI
MSLEKLKSSLIDVFLKFLVLGIFAIILIILRIISFSFLIQELYNFSGWILLAYLALVVQDYFW